jgi:hypothetical protein
MDGVLRGRRTPRILQRIERPEIVVVSLILAALAAVGWVTSGVWLAVAVALQLAVGGAGAVRLIGPAKPGLGLGRYATPAVAAISITLAGRVIPPGAALLLTPVAAVLLWSVLVLEMRAAYGLAGRTMLELAEVGVLFLAATGIWHLFDSDAWPPPLVLIGLVCFVLALRSAEGRGRGGVQGVGVSLLHTLAVAQVGAALVLLDLPGVASPALIALTFYAWGGAAEAVGEGRSGRSVAVEFGALAVLGLVMALLLHGLT